MDPTAYAKYEKKENTAYTNYKNQMDVISYKNQFAMIILILQAVTEISQICMQATTIAPNISVLANIPMTNFDFIVKAKDLNIYDSSKKSIDSAFNKYQKSMATQTTLNGQLDQCLIFMQRAKSKLAQQYR